MIFSVLAGVNIMTWWKIYAAVWVGYVWARSSSLLECAFLLHDVNLLWSFFKIKLDTKTLRCLFTSIFWPFPQGCVLFTVWRKEQKGLKISKLLMCVIVRGLSDVPIFDEQLSVSGLPFPGEIFYSFIYIFFEASNHDFWFMLIFSRLKLKSLVEK